MLGHFVLNSLIFTDDRKLFVLPAQFRTHFPGSKSKTMQLALTVLDRLVLAMSLGTSSLWKNCNNKYVGSESKY